MSDDTKTTTAGAQAIDTGPVYATGKTRAKKDKSGAANEGMEIIKTIFFALLIAFVLRVLLFQPFTIPSASMEPNLYEGDYIVVSKWDYGFSKHSIPFSPNLCQGRILDHTPVRGDIVVFKTPRDNKTDFIKRLIGLPGDRIQVRDNLLYINDQPARDVPLTSAETQSLITQVRETILTGRSFNIQDYGPTNELDNTQVFTVPQGHYFMLGDNRDNSLDSRVEPWANGVGLVPEENLVGRARIILFSWEPGASLWNPVSWFANLRLSRFFHVLH